MLSNKFFRKFNIWINCIAVPLGAPFHFDPKRQLVYSGFHSRRRCVRIWILLAIQNLFLVGAMIYFRKIKNSTYFNHAYLGWVLSSIWCLFLGFGAFNADNICYLLNVYFTFFRKYKGKSLLKRFFINFKYTKIYIKLSPFF